jgi:ABC-2 type transport system permease protein
MMRSLLRGLLRLTWLEVKIFVREPLGLIGNVVVPVVAFTWIGRAVGGGLSGASSPNPAMVGVNLAVFAALLISINAAQSLVTIMAIYRESGILKRLRATPLRPLTILSAHILVKLLFTALTLALTMAAGRRYLAPDVPVPWVAFGLATTVGMLGMLALGFLLASLAPTARFAQPIAGVVLYPLIAVSGLFFPVDRLPMPLQWLAHLSPATYAVSLMRGAWQHDAWLSHGPDLLGLAAISAILAALASRVFRWQ